MVIYLINKVVAKNDVETNEIYEKSLQRAQSTNSTIVERNIRDKRLTCNNF